MSGYLEARYCRFIDYLKVYTKLYTRSKYRPRVQYIIGKYRRCYSARCGRPPSPAAPPQLPLQSLPRATHRDLIKSFLYSNFPLSFWLPYPLYSVYPVRCRGITCTLSEASNTPLTSQTSTRNVSLQQAPHHRRRPQGQACLDPCMFPEPHNFLL